MTHDRYECPLKRCHGRLEVHATGTHADGTTYEYAICDRCGKTVELAVPIEHPSLFGGEL